MNFLRYFSHCSKAVTQAANIKDKKILITGGTIGLGYAFAQKVLEQGAKAVALLDLCSSPGESSVKCLEEEFGKGKAIFYPCDCTNVEQYAETFKKVVDTFCTVDIVINNAGILNDPKWHETVNLNVGGVVQGSLLALNHMSKLKGGSGGTVVNIASIVGYDIYSMCPVYCSSKHFVLAFSRCLAYYCDRTAVRFLVLCPGVTVTAIFDDFKTKLFDFVTEKDMDQLLKLKPQKPEHVGDALVQLVDKGENGAIWASEEEKPPHSIEIPPVKKVEVPK